MKTKPQQPQQNQNNILPNLAWNNALQYCTNQADHGESQRHIEKTRNSSDTYSSPRNQQCPVEDYSEEGKSVMFAGPICVQSAVDNDINSVEMCFDGSWRSPASSGLPSVSDVIERKLSSESMDSEILASSLDAAPSLDDVFDVLDEIDPFEPDLTMTAHAPLSAPSTQFMSQLYWSDRLYQPPSGPNACNSLQPFNVGLVKSLQSPSRGLITAMRRLCELLSKPRSDHLESVFVRLLNNALNDMEDAAQPQSKRRKRYYEKLPVSKRKRLNRSTGDAESRLESANISRSRAQSLKSHSLPVISTRVGRRTETVDLTNCEEREQQHQRDAKVTQNDSFVALEDTMSDFIESFLSKSVNY